MNLSNLLALAGTIVICSNAAWAEGRADHPCANVFEACKASGKQGPELRDCVRTIRGGGKVNGVNVVPSPECKAHEGHGGGEHHGGACANLVEACKAAGKQGRDVWECAKTLKNGGSVPGISAKPSEECKAQKRGEGRQ